MLSVRQINKMLRRQNDFACEPGTHIRAVAERVHGGRSTGVVSCGIFDGQDRLLLRGEFSVFYLGGYVETEAE